MKNLFFRFLVVISAAGILMACQKEGADIKPGLYVDQEIIKTFPTDTVRLKGTASNYIGMTSVVISCEAWNITEKYDLAAQTPEVFNFDYQLIVPSSATFNSVALDVEVTDVNGLKTVKSIPVEELEDFIAPSASPVLPEQVAVDYDYEAGKGDLTINLSLYDRRGLKSVTVDVPGISVSETTELSGMNATFSKTISFTRSGNYEVTVTVTDLAGNNAVLATEAVVMVAIEADPVENWSGLYLFNAAENPADYVDGFYKFMDPDTEPYTYKGSFYAPTADTKIYLAPTKSTDADLLGVDPNVSTKLMNKNGYVVPITVPGAGYYGIWVDILNGTFSFWEIDPETSATKCSEDIWVSGTGFSTFADWGATTEAMTRDGYRYTQNLAVNAGTIAYYFYTSGWARVFRADVQAKWWFESASGDVANASTDYTGPVEVIFDSVLPYGVIKKVTE